MVLPAGKAVVIPAAMLRRLLSVFLESLLDIHFTSFRPLSGSNSGVSGVRVLAPCSDLVPDTYWNARGERVGNATSTFLQAPVARELRTGLSRLGCASPGRGMAP